MSETQKTATRTSSRIKSSALAQPAIRKTRAATKLATATIVPAQKSARKPLRNRGNATDVAPAAPSKLTSNTGTGKNSTQSTHVHTDDREPIMAYLRIRPYLGGDELSSTPYLTPLNATSVRMTDHSHDTQSNLSRFRPSTLPSSSIYTFSHVFPPQTSQSDFFTKTTLPLVLDALQGQNGLLFTYGVTNSGKTFTVQGGTTEGSAGILPRTLDVIFNSIDGLQGDGRYRPVRLHGIELADPRDSQPPSTFSEPALTQVFGHQIDTTSVDNDVDPTLLQVDRNYEYTIWLSYAEVYNEKVYDLLDSVKGESQSSMYQNPRTNNGNPLLLMRKALTLRPSPPDDSNDTPGKYISGLHQFRVQSAAQAKALLKLGQLHRRVFGTLANRESSRSHAIVILKVVRGHRGDRNNPDAFQVSRLTLVDLAGSERMKHTQTTGDRLKEAGNINKSLMVLGQCMEVMRSNQRRLAASLSENVGKDGRMDTREVKKGLGVVPFRHSKLTELLMDYFVGDGRTVMIVNVNPYDTGYDENSHVMKFSALAREVYITPAPAPIQRPPAVAGPGKTKARGTTRQPTKENIPPPRQPHRRKVTISTEDSGRKISELEVLEEDEAEVDENDDDEPLDPLVELLFEEVERLRMELFESEMRCAIIEAETREEVMREMEERMRSMEKMYKRRLMNEVEQNEMKIDAKIDLLHRSGLFNSPVKQLPPRQEESELSDIEEDVDMNTGEDGKENHPKPRKETADDSEEEFSSARSKSQSLSPLAKKAKGKGLVKPPTTPSRNHTSEDETEEEDEMTEDDSTEEEEEAEDDEDEDEDEWVPGAPDHSGKGSTTNKARRPTAQLQTTQPSHQARRKSIRSSTTRVSAVEKEMNRLRLDSLEPEDSIVILPAKKFRPRIESVDEDDQAEEEEVSTHKKKKRQLAKKAVITEEQIEKIAEAVDRQKGGNIRRLTGRP